MQPIPPFQDANVEAVFAGFDDAARHGLLSLRALIFDTAAQTPGTGPLHECLKWGQPAFLTAQTKSGSTIRLGTPKSGGFALYTHCQTRLIPEFQALFPDDFIYDGTRALLFTPGQALPMDNLRLLIAAALTYHQKRR